MQSGWLRQYFVPQHNEQCQHTVGSHPVLHCPRRVSRRDFVKGGLVAGMTAGMAASDAVGGVRQAEAQTTNPMGKEWWPSPWGADDEIGASQRITPAKVLEAAKLIKTGKIYRLGMNLEPGIPLFGQRHFSLASPVALRVVRLGTRSSCITMRCSVAKSVRWDRSSTASAILVF